MDSKAKQRLTGAVILVALFVLLVPELLTGPSRPKPAEPGDESGMRRYTIDLSTPQSSVQPSTPAAQPEVNLPEVAQSAPQNAAARAEPGESAAPASAPVSAPVTAVPAPAAVPVHVPAVPASAPAPAPAVAQTSPARAPVAATPVPRSEAPRAGSFAVQLGTFEKRENADRLVRDMTGKGFNAFVAPVTKEGRELYRVRVGPTRDRAGAEALAAQLKRIGQPGSVVSIS